MIRTILIVTILYLSSCCPKLTPSQVVKVDTLLIERHDTVEVFIPGIEWLFDSIPREGASKESINNSGGKKATIRYIDKIVKVKVPADTVYKEVFRRDTTFIKTVTDKTFVEKYNWWKPVAWAFIGATAVLALILLIIRKNT